MTQFNCREGDTVIVAQRKRGRLVQEFLTVVQTGVGNEHGCPLDFLAEGKEGRRVKLSAFEGSEHLRIVVCPKSCLSSLQRSKSTPQ